MSDQPIQAALDTRLAAFSPAMSIAWPGIGFTPIQGTAWLRPTNLRSTTEQASVGAAGMTRRRGIYQVSVFWPAGSGVGAGLARATAIGDWFKRQALTSGGIQVRCEDAHVGPEISEPGWIQFPVSIPYFATT